MIWRAVLTPVLVLSGMAALQLPGAAMPARHTPQAGLALDPYHQREAAGSYRLRPKDELDIRVEGACIYSTRFEVDERGLIDVPFAGEVRAAGRTAAELASELARELKKYLRDPKVHVRVFEGRT